MKPLAIDLFCGLGGWAQGFLAEGYDVVGFDIERHDYGSGGYPGELVLADVQQLSGTRFRNAAVIVASPPCQAYSYMAMPWSRAKELANQYREDVTRLLALNCLFNSCFRIAAEAGVPLIVENVKGAQPWVGRAKYHYGSFYLWGDVPALMPRSYGTKLPPHINESIRTGKSPARWTNPAEHYFGPKPDGRKVPMNFHEFEKTGKPGRSFKSAAVDGLKTVGHVNKRDGHGHTRHLTNQVESDGVKQHGSGAVWFDTGTAIHSSKSLSRKAASAQIAKIPFPLAQHIARVFKPHTPQTAQAVPSIYAGGKT